MSERDNKMTTKWLQCRNIIAEFLIELEPAASQEDIDHNAAAIIARLSHGGFSLESIKDCAANASLRTDLAAAQRELANYKAGDEELTRWLEGLECKCFYCGIVVQKSQADSHTAVCTKHPMRKIESALTAAQKELQFYAREECYATPGINSSKKAAPIMYDKGKRARAALGRT